MTDIRRYVQRIGVLGIFWNILTSRGLFAIIIYRFRSWLLNRCAPNFGPIALLFTVLSIVSMHISRILTKSEICPHTDIKPGLFISNRGNVIIGANRIGQGCVIQEKVTIGRDVVTKEKSTIGDNVWIGANSVISGSLTIGSGSTIRESSVLTKSIPANCVVQGNPARVVKTRFDNSKLLANPYVSSHSTL